MLQLLNKGVDLNSSCWQNYLSLIQVKRYAPFFFVAIFLRKYDAVNTLFNNKYIMLASLLIAVITELLKCWLLVTMDLYSSQYIYYYET